MMLEGEGVPYSFHEMGRSLRSLIKKYLIDIAEHWKTK